MVFYLKSNKISVFVFCMNNKNEKFFNKSFIDYNTAAEKETIYTAKYYVNMIHL